MGSNKGTYQNYLADLCITFSLQNTITGKICFNRTTVASKEILLTNRSKGFYQTGIFETGLVNYQIYSFTLFCSPFFRIAYYTNAAKFIYQSDQELSNRDIYKNKKDMFSIFKETFQDLVDETHR